MKIYNLKGSNFMSFFHIKCKENTGSDIHKMFKTVGMKPDASGNLYCTCWGRERKSLLVLIS